MAVLNGVKTLNMVNGEVTKVEYNGEEYVKVADGIPKKGDIGLFKEKSWVHLANGTTYADILDVDEFNDPVVDLELGSMWYKDCLEYFRKEAEQSIKAGDKVRIKRGGIMCLHGFKDGDICEVSEVNHYEPRPLHLLSPGNKTLGFTTVDNVELVDEEADLSDEQVKKEQDSFDEGDIVVITDNTNGSRNKIGDIGVVGELRATDNIVSVDVPERPAREFVQGNFTKYSDMRHATAEEKAEFERKHGGFDTENVSTSKGIEEGDLVRVVYSPNALPEGTCFVVKSIDSDGIVQDPTGFIYRERYLELIEKGDKVYA